ncbi:MAG: hypothetical protein JXB04_02125 [Kiritimatiellae bacterium]|nr:hypothetical protein [Kiritimatiellia bacterium]
MKGAAHLTEALKRDLRMVRMIAARPFIKRRFHAYCAGTAKSGTNSIAAILHRFRTAHEPDSQRRLDLILAAAGGGVSAEEIRAFLLRRDRALKLELDSSHLNYFFCRHLANLFPEAQFIVTLRDCYTWADSFMDHQLRRVPKDRWRRYRDLRFGAGTFTHAPEEKELAARGLYTLDGYFSYWATHNGQALNTIPPDRLLVIRTREISQSLPRLAEFLRVPVEKLDATRSHANVGRDRKRLLQNIDRDFLEQKVNAHCRELMDKYFPEIRCFEDALRPGASCGTPPSAGG